MILRQHKKTQKDSETRESAKKRRKHGLDRLEYYILFMHESQQSALESQQRRSLKAATTEKHNNGPLWRLNDTHYCHFSQYAIARFSTHFVTVFNEMWQANFRAIMRLESAIIATTSWKWCGYGLSTQPFNVRDKFVRPDFRASVFKLPSHLKGQIGRLDDITARARNSVRIVNSRETWNLFTIRRFDVQRP